MEISIKVTIDLSDKLMGFINRLMPHSDDSRSTNNKQEQNDIPEAESKPVTTEKTINKKTEKTETKASVKAKQEPTSEVGNKEIATPETRPLEPQNNTEPPNKHSPKRTFEDLRGLFTEKVKSGKSAELQSIIKRLGASKLSEIAPEHFDEAYDLVRVV